MNHLLKKQLNLLTVLRGPAALLVFAFHILHNTQWTTWVPLASMGYTGVSLFFVLSGFVLTWSYNPARSYKEFLVRRIARIYPLHLLMFCVAVLVPVTAYEFELLPALANLFLLQSWVPAWNYIFSMNAVSWSLSNELFFYVLTPVFLLWLSRPSLHKYLKYAMMIGLWGCITLVAALIARHSNFADVVVYSNPAARLGEFILGMMSAKLTMRLCRTPRKALTGFYALSSVVLFLAVLLILSRLALQQTISSIVVGPFAAFMIMALAVHETSSKKAYDTQIWRILVFAGEASFAFYLIHELVIINFAAILGREHTRVAGSLLALGTLVISAVLAVCAHQYIERPCQKKIVSWTDRRKGAST
ncbi:acyltransferase family protein [Rothia terrae]|uniref:acyltransferase family protein n=1 Tax=Rothia terrae TaxID=396015 RepID=UPI00288280B8|nr:acyltransferase [Rothia terrae]MDT0190352.1 acyltransferase [Rothia terrae]